MTKSANTSVCVTVCFQSTFIFSVKLFFGTCSPSVMLNHRVDDMKASSWWFCGSGLWIWSTTITETSLCLPPPDLHSLTHSWLKSPSCSSSRLLTKTQLSTSTPVAPTWHRASATFASSWHSSACSMLQNPELRSLRPSRRQRPSPRPSA